MIFVFCPFWIAKHVFNLKNRKLFLKIENKEKKQLPNIPLIFSRGIYVCFEKVPRMDIYIEKIEVWNDF